MKNLMVILLVASLSACATSRGFDRGNLREQLSVDKVITEADIATALELKPQLPEKFKLAVYFSQGGNWNYYSGQWTWQGDDKDKLLTIKDELIAKQIISDLFVINDSIVIGQDKKSIRLAAARAGADAVIIINGVSDVDRYNNFIGATYVLLVTPFFLPGTEVDALFMSNATMWDVRNEYLYLSVDAEGMAKEVTPAFFAEEKRVIKEAKTTAIDTLKDELLSRLVGMGSQ